MKNIETRMRVKAVICWSLAVVFLAGIMLFQSLYLQPEIVDILFTFTVFMIAFGVRGVYQETKDLMLAEMGEVELSCLKAQIEQVLKARSESWEKEKG